MSRYSEQTFDGWRQPASKSEEQRISNAISMIKDAIRASDDLKNRRIEIFAQGSYANNTNVRIGSDIDVCVMLKDAFFTEYPDGITDEHFGFTQDTNNFSTYREQILNALIEKYGSDNVKPGNKSIKIISNSYRVEADAVPSFQYRNYRCNNSRNVNTFKEGVKFYPQNPNTEVINYPIIHIENGKAKNKNTYRRYKRLVRIFKHIRYKMIDDGESVNEGITSFLIECLLWNTPNSTFNNNDTWAKIIKQAITYLQNKTQDEKDCKKWGEVSEMFYLFHSSRKWSVKMTNDFLAQMWNYLAF